MSTVIRTLLALDGGLVRGALAYVLSAQPDIDVVAQLEPGADVWGRTAALEPDVAVVDMPTVGAGRRLPCRALVLAAPREARALSAALRRQAHVCGFLGHQVSPERIVAGVRRLARGEPVADPELVVAALNRSNPLTEREMQVLQIAASGWPAKEIARELCLSPGTVRNYLSRALSKVGARTRIEAVRIARDAGWIWQ
jgi:two-component system response regulator DesR